MIDLEFVQSLIRALDESSLDSIELERGGTRVRLAKSPPGGSGRDVMGHVPVAMPHPPHNPGPVAPPPAPDVALPEPDETAPAADSSFVDVTSPMVGTFYRAPAPDAQPYVQVGGRVAQGDTLCIIEAMKLMNELEAEVAGTVVEVCVENAEPVEYGQVLFRIDPA